jgi:hypothetical protein
MQSDWPKTLDEAVKICLLTMTPEEKKAIKNTSEENLIMFHMGWAMNIRNEFGLWKGNQDLIESCGEYEADGASIVIVQTVWEELNRQS